MGDVALTDDALRHQFPDIVTLGERVFGKAGLRRLWRRPLPGLDDESIADRLERGDAAFVERWMREIDGVD